MTANPLSTSLTAAILLGAAASCSAQQPGHAPIIGSVTLDVDALEYVLLASDTTQPKPLLLWYTGSEPVPLYIESPSGDSTLTWPTFPAADSALLANFQVAVPSKFGVPITVAESDLDERSRYRGVVGVDEAHVYLRRNFPADYALAGRMILEQLRREAFIDGDSIFVAGHSAGARVAARVAAEEGAGVAGLGFLGSPVQGRVYGFLNSEIPDGVPEAEIRIAELEAWRQVREAPELPHRSTIANSASSLPDLLSLNAPVFAAYGTADSPSRDMLVAPYTFVREGKPNLCIRIYQDREHSFYPVDETGQPNYAAPDPWPRVWREMSAYWRRGSCMGEGMFNAGGDSD